MNLFKIFIFNLAFFCFQTAVAQGNWAVLINGGRDKSKNYPHYKKALIDMHTALLEKEFKRDHIKVLSSDGTNPEHDGHYTDEYSFNSPISLQNDGVQDVVGGGNREDISKTFSNLSKKIKASRLSKKIKPNDRIILFLTGHGDRDKGTTLWNGEFFSTDDWKKELNKLPSSITVQIISNYCYAGHLLELTSNNTCVVTNVDADNKNTSYRVSDDFATHLSEAIRTGNTNKSTESNNYIDDSKSSFLNLSIWKKIFNNKNKKTIPLLDAFEYAKANDHPKNTRHMTSIDWLLTKTKQDIDYLVNDSYQLSYNSQSSTVNLTTELEETIQYFKNNNRKEVYLKHLSKKASDLLNILNSSQLVDVQKRLTTLQRDHAGLEEKYHNLSPQEQQELSPELINLTKELQKQIEADKETKNKIEQEYEKFLSEMRFLKHSNDEQFEQYRAIRRCLDYEI